MTKSFFEKLTGASGGENTEVPKDKKKSIVRKKGSVQDWSAPTGAINHQSSDRKIIKKDSIEMSQPEKKQSGKKTELERPLLTKAEEDKEKDWLEEAEGEEGQLTIDVYQTPSDVVIKSTIAGVKPEDIDISITNDMVTIRGKRIKDEKVETESYYYQELYWGAFSRSVILPVEVDADKARADIKNGILTVRLPKSEKVKTKKIKVRTLE